MGDLPRVHWLLLASEMRLEFTVWGKGGRGLATLIWRDKGPRGLTSAPLGPAGPRGPGGPGGPWRKDTRDGKGSERKRAVDAREWWRVREAEVLAGREAARPGNGMQGAGSQRQWAAGVGAG